MTYCYNFVTGVFNINCVNFGPVLLEVSGGFKIHVAELNLSFLLSGLYL